MGRGVGGDPVWKGDGDTMQDLPTRMGMLGLFGLALVTASTNVESTQRSYRLAEMARQERELRLMITHHDDSRRRLLTTDVLAQHVERVGWADQDLYPSVSDPAYRVRMPMALSPRPRPLAPVEPDRREAP